MLGPELVMVHRVFLPAHLKLETLLILGITVCCVETLLGKISRFLIGLGNRQDTFCMVHC